MITALKVCQFQWLILLVSLLLIAFFRKSSRPILAAVLIYGIMNIDTAMLFLPKIAFFSHFKWNWQGKILELSLSLLLIYGFGWLTPQQVGLRLPKNNLSFLYVTLLGVMYVVVTLAIAVNYGHILNYPSLETLLYQATMPGLAEEILYRGIYLAILNDYLGKQWTILKIKLGWGVILVTLLFIVVHWIHYNPVTQQIVLMENSLDLLPFIMIGLFLGIIREKTGSIWPAVVFHNICNLGF